MESYYWKKCSIIFAIFLLIALSSILQNHLFAVLSLLEQPVQIAVALTYAIFILAKVSNRKIPIAFLSLQLIGWLIYVFVEDQTIGG